MHLTRSRGPRLLLSYEMNVHPGETLQELRAALHRFVVPVRDRVAPGRPFGLAPRIGRGLIRELANRRTRARLADELKELELFPFTVNAFPLEDFHARRVKENVYAPPWTRATRAAVTERVADWLVETMPEGEVATISTLGGTYRPWGHGPADFRKMATHYLRVVDYLANLETRTGRTILLCAEPEPDTTFEVASDVIEWVEGYVRPQLTTAAARRRFERHFAVNLDVCHQSVLFRDPVKEWKALEKAGLHVGKLHLTNALALPRPGRSPRGLEELRSFHEPRYLHQFAVLEPDGALFRGPDLPALAKAPLRDAQEVRCHFHVPLSRSRLGRLRTTRDDTALALKHALRHPQPPHLVIETYTWPILARRDAQEFLASNIVREFRWVLAAC